MYSTIYYILISLWTIVVHNVGYRVGTELHPLDVDLSPQLQDEAPGSQDPLCGLRHLDVAAHACAVHAARQVHRCPQMSCRGLVALITLATTGP